MEKEDFIKRLTEWRLNKDVSAREMSLSLGMGENYINTLEHGESLPNMSTFFHICDYLGISPRDFFIEEMRPKNKALFDMIMLLPDDYVQTMTELIKITLKHLN